MKLQVFKSKDKLLKIDSSLLLGMKICWSAKSETVTHIWQCMIKGRGI